MTALALDIGATKFAAALVDPAGAVGESRRVGVPESGVWDACRGLLAEVAGDMRIGAVGIGSAGPVDIDAGVCGPLNIPEWADGFPIVDSVRKLFPEAEIRLAIDGVCLVLAEQRLGAARGFRNVLALTVSSGIGGGIISDDRVVMGRTGNGGHVGHIVVPGQEEPCACGGFGCVEAVASGKSSVRWARRQGWAGISGVELAAAAHAGRRSPWPRWSGRAPPSGRPSPRPPPCSTPTWSPSVAVSRNPVSRCGLRCVRPRPHTPA